ncbi:beta-galactosidase [Cellulomonas wangsupingiae]|uniref:Beta-galactosidase n=1 Tax=Cellulomonas wangsupingiae TaxID=2968085 RepID=A0ABY5K606_9CELL|nr:beta-galactosidase [Cellulomonas wangsupingiae]MCC2336173.1 beta-galactosidase [Cellulomonas wangsupingiae]MCM0641579.1 beta-galactosidase [Cellulomonas wangsupingiae]UUI64582.1 beta-galactosidase [Cellulomonas wangsupingiae]
MPTDARIRYGADYNPEQWSQDVWDEDVRLMRDAHVTTATVGVFSWSRLEPRPGEYDFAWLDDVLDRLHAGGVRVVLATATASPPAWFARRYPDSLPVTEDGVRLAFGSRQQYSPSSPDYRRHALALVEQVAARYADHPALEMWHVNNEYGCEVSRSYDAHSERAFRAWLEQRYGTVEELNRAWGTDFWSQRYGSFDEVGVPSVTPSFRNPTQELDFRRFSSDAMLALHRAESQVIRRYSPDVPITTNFMGFFPGADYWAWAPHVDVVSDDAYPDPADPEAYVRLAAVRDLMRGLGQGRPWLLMEQATSAVNWRPRNAPRPRGQHRAHSLQAVARGADGVLHFQWRQSAAGAERFHSAMLPHAGADTRLFRDVAALGEELAGLSDLVGTAVPARVALVLDWDSWWALEQPATPTRVEYVERFLDWYAPFLRRGVTVDVVQAGADVTGYDLVVVPVQHVARREHLDALDAYVRGGGHLVVTYASAVVDQDLRVHLGGYLGPLRATLGVRVEELAPTAGPDGTPGGPLRLVGDVAGAASLWQDVLVVDEAQVVATFADGYAAGGAAVTRREHGDGVAWYVATQPAADVLDALVDRLLTECGVPALLAAPVPGVEAVRRGDRLAVVNHTAAPVVLQVAGLTVDLGPHDARLLPGV